MGPRVKRDPCASHPGQDVTATCGCCGKPICRECVAANGYYCSPECLQENRERVDAVRDSSAAENMEKYQRGMRGFNLMIAAILLLILTGTGIVLYRLFLDPSGAVVWEWPVETQRSLQIVGISGDQVLIAQDAGIIPLALKNGKPKASFESVLSDMQTVTLHENRLIGLGSTRIVDLSMDRRALKEVLLSATAELGPIANTAYTRACYLSRADSEDPESEGPYKLHTVCLESHQEIHAVPLSGDIVQIQLLGIDGNDVVLLAGRHNPEDPAQARRWLRNLNWSIELIHYQSGKARRRASLSGQAARPMFKEGWAVFSVAETLYAVNLGQGKQYDYPVKSVSLVAPDCLIDAGQLLILYPSGMVCYSLDDGREQWTLDASARTSNIRFIRDTMFMLGERIEKGTIDVSTLPGLTQPPDDLSRDLNMNRPTIQEKVISLLAAVDRKTGKPLWMEEGIRGDMLTDGKRLVVMADVSKTSNLGFFKKESELFVRQFHPSTGKKLYQTVSKGVAVVDPQLSGNRVVARLAGNKDRNAIVGIALR